MHINEERIKLRNIAKKSEQLNKCDGKRMHVIFQNETFLWSIKFDGFLYSIRTNHINNVLISLVETKTTDEQQQQQLSGKNTFIGVVSIYIRRQT